jgi:hypothetical protein
VVWPWPALFLGIAAVVAVWYARPYIRPKPGDRVQRDLNEMRKLADRPAEFDRALSLGNRILENADRFPQFVGEANYLVGCVHLRKAADLAPGVDGDELRAAVAAFEKAEVGGVPDADQPKLAHKFGKALHLANADPESALAHLLRGDDVDAPAERWQTIAEAHLRVKTPDLKAALEATNHQISLLVGVEPKVEAQARMRAAELNLRLNNPADARKALQKIDASAPSDLFMASRMLLARCFQGEGRWAEAASTWEMVRGNTALTPAQRGAVLYELGFCHWRGNRPADAVTAWGQAQVQGGDAGQAAALRLAEMQLATPAERAHAVEAVEKALEGVAKPDDYKNAVIPREDAARFLERSALDCREQADFASATKLADLYAKLVPAKGHELAAEVAAGWGQVLWADAQKAVGPAAKQAADDAKQQFRKAAAASADAATDDRPVPERVECLRKAVSYYFKANEKLDIECGLGVLERLEKLAPAAVEGELPFLKALARQNLGQKAQAADDYRAIAKQDSNPNAPRARYQLALLQMDDRLPKREDEDAKLDLLADELEQNLTLAIQEKDREVHEMSMYLLGEVVYQRREYVKAETKLDAALRNYPNSGRALQAKFLLGRCHWYQAAQESRLLHDKNMPAKDRDAAKERYRKFLEKARAPFEDVEKVLLDRDEKKGLADADKPLLRQAQFAATECAFFLEEYEEAVRRYKLLRLRYANQFEELVALSQLWQCYEKYLNQPESARPLVDAMRDLVKSLPDTAFDGSTPIQKREFWQKWLDQVAPPAAP